MRIQTFALGPLQTNCHVLAKDGLAVAVDPGGDPAPILEYLRAHGLTLTHILNTHLHFDHTYGNMALAEATGAPILCAKEDLFLLEDELGRGGVFGLPPVSAYDYATIEPGEHEFAGLQCRVYRTPGHSPGSLTFYFPEAGAACVGDLIFFRSVGRTDFPGGDIETLKRSVREVVFGLPPETLLLSGHGPETTVVDESNHNPFFGGF